MVAEPSFTALPVLAFSLNMATPSFFSPIFNVCASLPTTSRCADVFRDTATCASLPEPGTLLATPTETSNSSPGAAASGAFGESTKSPCTMALLLSVPMVDSLTATAINRSVPLKVSGTV